MAAKLRWGSQRKGRRFRVEVANPRLQRSSYSGILLVKSNHHTNFATSTLQPPSHLCDPFFATPPSLCNPFFATATATLQPFLCNPYLNFATPPLQPPPQRCNPSFANPTLILQTFLCHPSLTLFAMGSRYKKNVGGWVVKLGWRAVSWGGRGVGGRGRSRSVPVATCYRCNWIFL